MLKRIAASTIVVATTTIPTIAMAADGWWNCNGGLMQRIFGLFGG